MVRVISGQARNPAILQAAIQGVTNDDGDVEADVAAIAPYLNINDPTAPAFQGRATAMRDLYQEYLDDSAIDFEALRNNMSQDLTVLNGLIQQNQQVTQNSGLQLITYEFNQHMVPHTLRIRVPPAINNAQPRWIETTTDQDGEIDQEFIDLLGEFNRSTHMQELYETFLSDWLSAGGRTVTFFYDYGDISQYGFWGHKIDYRDSDGTAVKFNVAKEFATSP